MLKHKTYEFSVKGLENAIADRHRYEATRRVLIGIGIIGLIAIVSPSTASVVAFKCI